jgi:hypothetical protein
MNKSYRIKTNVNPNRTNNIKLKLEQEVDQFEILSLKIDQENVYNDFNCNHGVLVGRVVANGGVGIPNAKISVFIPLREEDENKPDIVAVYPYKNPRDEDVNGKRYNLLPRVATQNPDTGIYSPAQPFGSFPTKEEFITNSTLLEVYEKYYKYTTVTNQSGDYMIFGAPVGIQTIHMSVDTTDIGRFSMTPATLINNLGYSPNLFIDNGTRIKPSSDLNDLPNIETQEISVDIIPFCGDEETFNIGITRQDFRIRAELVNTFTIFGTSMTPPRDGFWNDFNPDGTQEQEGTSRRNDEDGFEELCKFKGETGGLQERNIVNRFRAGEMSETIMYLPTIITDEEAETYDFDPESDLVVLSQDSYTRNVDNSGNFAYQIACNRKKVITSESGEDIEVPADNVDGVFTEFRGLMLCEMTFEELDVDSFTVEFGTDEAIWRSKFRIPQAFDTNYYSPNGGVNPKEYLGKHKKFQGNKIYSVSQFIATERIYSPSTSTDTDVKNGGDALPEVNNPDPNSTAFGDQLLGHITLSNYTDDNSLEVDTSLGLQPTGKVYVQGNKLVNIFSGEWLNFCLLFHQWGIVKDTDARNGTMPYVTPLLFFVETDQGGGMFDNFWRISSNSEPIGAGLTNNFGFITPLKHPLDFIELTKQDLLKFLGNNNRGVRYSEIILPTTTTKATSMFNGRSNEPIPSQARRNATFSDSTLADTGFSFDDFSIPTNTTSDNPYFFKGVGQVDLISFLDNLNILD